MAFCTSATLWKNIWSSRTDGVVMSNVAKAPRHAELRTVRRNWPHAIEPRNFVRRWRAYKITCARKYISRYTSQCRGMLAVPAELVLCLSHEDLDHKNLWTLLASDFKRVLASAVTTSAVFFSGTVCEFTTQLKNRFPWSLPILKRERN